MYKLCINQYPTYELRGLDVFYVVLSTSFKIGQKDLYSSAFL